jgi:hypothetical protein
MHVPGEVQGAAVAGSASGVGVGVAGVCSAPGGARSPEERVCCHNHRLHAPKHGGGTKKSGLWGWSEKMEEWRGQGACWGARSCSVDLEKSRLRETAPHGAGGEGKRAPRLGLPAPGGGLPRWGWSALPMECKWVKRSCLRQKQANKVAGGGGEREFEWALQGGVPPKYRFA